MANRDGKRKTREQLSKRRVPELGYYLIVTDTEETEANYFKGLRDSIPAKLRQKLVIETVKGVSTAKLVDEALEKASKHPQYCQPWIVFDRDQVKGFDDIISTAVQKDVHVGWSNPCIEIWFSAYFGSIPTYQGSVECCKRFAERFESVSGQKYKKSDSAIYAKLCQYGNEQRAIQLAKQKYAENIRNGKSIPSKMCPCTTVYVLIEEITSKVNRECD